jgi:hypothetical protein
MKSARRVFKICCERKGERIDKPHEQSADIEESFPLLRLHPLLRTANQATDREARYIIDPLGSW